MRAPGSRPAPRHASGSAAARSCPARRRLRFAQDGPDPGCRGRAAARVARAAARPACGLRTDDRRPPRGPRQPGASARQPSMVRSARGITSRRAVWVSEKLATLLSTRSTERAAAMMSTSLMVAFRPLRDTTQIAPALADVRSDATAQDRELLERVGGQQDQVGSFERRTEGHVMRALREGGRECRVDVADDRDPDAGLDPQLVQQGCRVDALGHRCTVAPAQRRVAPDARMMRPMPLARPATTPLRDTTAAIRDTVRRTHGTHAHDPLHHLQPGHRPVCGVHLRSMRPGVPQHPVHRECGQAERDQVGIRGLPAQYPGGRRFGRAAGRG